MQSHFQRENIEKRSIKNTKSQNLWILASNFIPLKWQFIGKIIYFCYNTQNCTYVWARKSTEFRMSFNVCLSNSKKDFDSLCCYTRYVHKKGIFKGHLGHEAKISLRVCFTFCECDIAYTFSLKKVSCSLNIVSIYRCSQHYK